MRGSPGDVVGHPSTLAIGNVREGDERRRVRDGVGLLHRIADCVDVGIVRLVRLADRNTTARSQFQAGSFGEAHIRPHPDRADNEIRREDPPVGKCHGAVLHRRHGRSGLDVHAVSDELVGDKNGKLRIERRQHLRSGLDDRDIDALPHEVLGHLEPDEPGTDHDRGRGCDVDVRREAGCVFDRPQGANPVIAGNRRAHRCCAHAEHELVVADTGLRTRDRRTCRDGVPDAVDGDDLVVHSDVEPEAVEQLLRRLECEVVLLFDQPPDEIGQAAVGEGDVAGPFENGDAGVSVEAAKASRRRHPSRDATDDHHAHGQLRSSGSLPSPSPYVRRDTSCPRPEEPLAAYPHTGRNWEFEDEQPGRPGSSL